MTHRWRRSRVQEQHNIQALLEQTFVVARDAAVASAPKGPRHQTYRDVAVVVEAMLRALEPDDDRAKFGSLPTAAREVIDERTATVTIYAKGAPPMTFHTQPINSKRADDARKLVSEAAEFLAAHQAHRTSPTKVSADNIDIALFGIRRILRNCSHSFGPPSPKHGVEGINFPAALTSELERTLNRENCSPKMLAISALVVWSDIPRARAKDILRHG